MSFAAFCVVLTFALALLVEVSVAPELESSMATENVDTTPAYYPIWPLHYQDKLYEVTNAHQDRLFFIQKMMKVDFLWWPILSEPVVLKQLNVPYFDHYQKVEPTENIQTILPFEFISTMLTGNTFTGSDVSLAMNLLKSGMACSVLKHVSFEVIVLHILLYKNDIPDDDRKLFQEWLINMTKLAISKLIAMNSYDSENPQQSITQVQNILVDMLLPTLLQNSDDIVNKLQEIGSKMYNEIKNGCSISKEDIDPYRTLINNLNRKNIVKELKVHRTQFTETLRVASNVYDIDLLMKHQGDIVINDEIIHADHTINYKLDMNMMKKAMLVNYIKMYFFYLNLPIQTIDDSQGITLSKTLEFILPKEPSTAPQSV